jgi:hypothetical protein
MSFIGMAQKTPIQAKTRKEAKELFAQLNNVPNDSPYIVSAYRP